MFNRRRLIALGVALLLCVAALPLSFINATVFNVSASTERFNHEAPTQAAQAFATREININNGNFADATISDTTGFTTTIAGWSPAETSPNATSGILDTHLFNTWRNNDDALANLPFLQHPPTQIAGGSGADNNVLAITTRGVNLPASAGYTTGVPLEFHADGFFIVEVDFYAVGGFGAMYLIPMSDDMLPDGTRTSIPALNHPFIHGGTGELAEGRSVWQRAMFFVQTDQRSGAEFNLGLWLGNRSIQTNGGVVYFDNASARSVTEEIFKRDLERRANYEAITLQIDLRQNDQVSEPYEYTIEDFSSERTMSEAHSEFAYTSQIPTMFNFEDVNFLHPHTGPLARNVIALSARNGNAYMRLSGFTINRSISYMISFYSLSSGNANMAIIDPREPDDVHEHFVPFGEVFPVFSGESDATQSRNGWTLNTVFITGEIFEDVDVDIEFWIGGPEQVMTGWLLVDDFQISRVSHQYMSQHEGSPNVQTIHMEQVATHTPIPNGMFNVGTVSDVNMPFPLRAADWELTAGNEEDTRSGIVNTDAEHWARSAGDPSNFANATNPGPVTTDLVPHANNNIFMLQNTAPTYQVLTSSTFSLHQGAYNLITFDMSTIHRPSEGLVLSAVIQFEHNGQTHEIARINMNRPVATGVNFTPSDWRSHGFVIKGSNFTSHNVQIAFIMGIEGIPASGPAATAFIDNVTLHEPFEFAPGHVSADLSSTMQFFGTDEDNAARISTQVTADNTLRINTVSHQHVVVRNNLTEDLYGSTEGSFYRYSFDFRIITDLAAVAITPDRYDGDPNFERPDDLEWGVNVSLSEFYGGFTNLRPADLMRMPTFTHDGWVTLHFYIRVDSSRQLQLVIEFGNEFYAVQGTVEIRNTNLEEIDQFFFNESRDLHDQAVAEDRHTNIAIAREHDRGYDPDDDDDEDTGPGAGRDRDLDWLIIPTIIMAAALIFALFAVLLRRYQRRRHYDQKHTSYAKDDAGVRGATKASPSLVAASAVEESPTDEEVEIVEETPDATEEEIVIEEETAPKAEEEVVAEESEVSSEEVVEEEAHVVEETPVEETTEEAATADEEVDEEKKED
ncbi:MAG: hypothetical protein FWE38_01580 [Firmicutes bacterium]|nr:hypothetical protein [Bacillota bacterium]